jgi:arsenite methyltransferase
MVGRDPTAARPAGVCPFPAALPPCTGGPVRGGYGDGVPEEEQDRWARWVLRCAHAGDAGVAERAASLLAVFRDGVLDRAEITGGDVLLDVGAGAGLIGFAALERVGPGGRVIFSDVSADLLAECRRRAEAEGVLDRCEFVQAAAEDLRGIAAGSVDVVTTRSVLIYVQRKDAAFAEFFRVLRPGGRLSLFEPINSFRTAEVRWGLFGVDMRPVAELAAKVAAVYTSRAPEQDPMLNFDERDLLRLAGQAGFTALDLSYRAEVEVPAPPASTDWDVLKKMAPNPLAPTYEEAVAGTLTGADRDRFEAHLRATLAAGGPLRTTQATAYLRAVRP